MKRKATYAILTGMLFFLISFFMMGCGNDPADGNGEGVSHEGSQIKPIREETSQVEFEKDALTLEKELKFSVVQIFCGSYSGSGVVWEVTDKEVRIISAGHLLEKAETCDVMVCQGITYQARVEKILEDCDIGFAVFSAETLKEDQVELTAVLRSSRGAEELVRGEGLAVYGSMDCVAGNFVEGYLIAAETESKLPDYEKEQTLLIGGIRREVTEIGSEETGIETKEASTGGEEAPGLIDSGMSGSGVFDKQGCLLGILTGGDGKDQFAAVPVWRFRADK